MRLEEFDFELPEHLIAQSPLEDRSASKLLCLDKFSGEIKHMSFRDVPSLLEPGDVLVMNDTRVSARRLTGFRKSGGKVEALILRRAGDDFEALTRPAKKLPPGSEINFECSVIGTVLDDMGGGLKRIRLENSDGSSFDISTVGKIPLPPYIHEEIADEERYQTVFGLNPGSAAAPTAGLHFTSEILESITASGVKIANVTLDVGLDTFRPVQTELIEDHVIHGETCRISESAATTINACSGRIVAVGTTSARTLESFAIAKHKVQSGEMSTQIFIRPGHDFQVVDAMFTNFHLPKTTMLFMISALASSASIRRAYEAATKANYRFLSFGDSMFIG